MVYSRRRVPAQKQKPFFYRYRMVLLPEYGQDIRVIQRGYAFVNAFKAHQNIAGGAGAAIKIAIQFQQRGGEGAVTLVNRARIVVPVVQEGDELAVAHDIYGRIADNGVDTGQVPYLRLFSITR